MQATATQHYDPIILARLFGFRAFRACATIDRRATSHAAKSTAPSNAIDSPIALAGVLDELVFLPVVSVVSVSLVEEALF
jgi:hypothetical protein